MSGHAHPRNWVSVTPKRGRGTGVTAELALYGRDLFGDPIEPPGRSKMSNEFLVPPFSIISAREGWWQERKRAWLSYGIESEVGRDAAVGGSKMVAGYDEDGTRKTGMVTESDASIFDPVLCELIYRWFSQEGGQVVDPFAGGSVRGVVASILGRDYWGSELRPEQVSANRIQGEEITPDSPPTWVCGDSLETMSDSKPPRADLVFSCPPYGDLEKYSDDPRDLSAQEYHTFIANYKRIILRCYNALKQNRFACFVVGEFRDKRGHYRNFVGDTISAFQEVGFGYYNEGILVTPTGSLPMRAGKQFKASRKWGKGHQNILVFVKGSGKIATEEIGQIE